MKKSTHAGVLALLFASVSLTGCLHDRNDDKKSAEPAPTPNPFNLSVGVTGSGQVSSTPAGIDCGSDCSEALASGSNITLTATPSSGFTFTGWSGDCSGNSSSCALTMSANRAVTATFTATPAPPPPPATQFTLSVSVAGTGSVSSTPAGIACGTDCTEPYDDGTSVTLTAVASTGSQFTGWSGACTGSGSCIVAMSANQSVTATFTPNQYGLTVQRSGAGSITSTPTGINCGSDCSENYSHGTSVTLTAVPDANQQFSGWANACTGMQTTCTVVMTEQRTVSASFTPVQRALTVTVNGTGTVTSTPAGISCGSDCTENYNHGASVTLTAAPGPNQQFSGWLGACSGVTPSCTLAMTDARNVTATFAAVQRNLTVGITGTGTVTSTPAGINCGSDCDQNYDHGTTVTLMATTDTGFQFSGWGGACSGSGSCVVTMDAAKSVTTEFAATPTPDPGGSLTVGYDSAAQKVTASTVVLDLAMPSSGNYPAWVSRPPYPGMDRAATHVVLPGGYFGRGFSRFSPGNVVDGHRGEHYCGIGQIHGFDSVGDSSRMVVGQLVRFGTTFFTDMASVDAIYGDIKDIVLINNTGERPMMNTKGSGKAADRGTGGTRVFGACDGTACNTKNDTNPPYDYFNDGQHQPDINAYLGQWIWVEFQFNSNAPVTRTRVWTADGVWQGKEIIAPWASPGRVTTLDIIGFVNSIPTPGAQPYYDLERVEFRVGTDSNITPPAGFPGSAR